MGKCVISTNMQGIIVLAVGYSLHGSCWLHCSFWKNLARKGCAVQRLQLLEGFSPVRHLGCSLSPVLSIYALVDGSILPSYKNSRLFHSLLSGSNICCGLQMHHTLFTTNESTMAILHTEHCRLCILAL